MTWDMETVPQCPTYFSSSQASASKACPTLPKPAWPISIPSDSSDSSITEPFHSGSALHLDASFGDNPILQDEIRQGIAGRIASGNFQFHSVHRGHRPDSSPSCPGQVSSVCPRCSSRKIGGPRHRTILWHEHKQRSLPRSGIQLMCHQSFKIFKS